MRIGRSLWNGMNRPDECKTEALEGDILECIDGMFFLCERTNGYNNILAFAIDGTSTIRHVKAMLKFVITLWEDYGIKFIRVEGTTKRYRFLDRFYPYAVKDKNIKERNVYYCKLDEDIIKRLKQEIE